MFSTLKLCNSFELNGHVLEEFLSWLLQSNCESGPRLSNIGWEKAIEIQGLAINQAKFKSFIQTTVGQRGLVFSYRSPVSPDPVHQELSRVLYIGIIHFLREQDNTTVGLIFTNSHSIVWYMYHNMQWKEPHTIQKEMFTQSGSTHLVK